jgi:hypothetical protein
VPNGTLGCAPNGYVSLGDLIQSMTLEHRSDFHNGGPKGRFGKRGLGFPEGGVMKIFRFENLVKMIVGIFSNPPSCMKN